MAEGKIKINRAPVLTLWAAIVAERLGYEHETALTMGRAVAGMNAYSKGKSLGIIDEAPAAAEKAEKSEEKGKGQRQRYDEERFELLGRAVPAADTPQGLRATAKGEPISPAGVERYLAGKFRDRLNDVRAAMAELAESYPPDELRSRAYELYEEFRPAIPSGSRGWGAYGELDLGKMRELAKR